MAAIRVVGVRGDPCGAVRWTSPTHCTTRVTTVLLPQHRDWSPGF